MACKKYSIVNNGNSTIYFNYQRCDDAMWEYQESLMPGESKNLWVIPGTFSTPFNISNFQLIDEGVFPPVVPSPTPSTSAVPLTQTPTNTETPTQTPTPTPTQTTTQTQTPTQTTTQTQTPTQTTTQTPSVTPPPAFISIWSASTNGDTITLPLESSGFYDFTVDWGDGTNIDSITTWDDPLVTHTYTTQGLYTVTIRGTIEGFSFNNSGDFLKLIEITQWGVLKLGDSGGYFFGCYNLTLTGLTDSLNLVGMTNLSDMFVGCYSITTIPNINNWDVSQIQNMSRTFLNASNFNDDISSWNVSSVNNMFAMFFGANTFNSDISNWERNSPDVSTLSNVQRMDAMFAVAVDFNRDISNWNTSSVVYMNQMFESATSFDAPIGSWITSNVQDMSSMLKNATLFNQPLDGWDVSYCTNFTNFMTGKNSDNYSPENVSSLLQSWSSQGLQPFVTLDLGSINVPDSNSGYINTLTGSPNNWVVNYGQLIFEYDLGYDVSSSVTACSNILSVYWSDSTTFATGGCPLYSDASLATLATPGYYSDYVKWYQVDGTGYSVTSANC